MKWRHRFQDTSLLHGVLLCYDRGHDTFTPAHRMEAGIKATIRLADVSVFPIKNGL